MAKRIEKVNELIREVISKIIHRGIQFPEAALVTITRVVTSSDLHYANVFITVLSEKEGVEEEVLRHLGKEIVGLQRALNKALRMRPVPRMAFLIDEEEDRRERVERLLGETRKNDILQ